MAQFHFVEDYERHVSNLLAAHPIDEAMSLAVGGNYDLVGQIECALMGYAGLRNRMSVLDLGCGSGRLATALGKQMKIEYTGIDVVQPLLDYAKTRAPRNYKFIKSQTLKVPVPDRSFDFVCAFSLFTHLLHTETYLYLEECKRALRKDGRIVFSFIEFAEPDHWKTFSSTLEAQRTGPNVHLNQYIERTAIKVWCDHLGLKVDRFIDSGDAPWKTTGPLGQSIVMLANS